MANQNTKKKVQVWMDPDLVAQIDGVAARDGKTRAVVMAEAAAAYVSGSQSGDAAAAKLDAIAAKLDAVRSDQAALKAEQQAQAALLAAKIDSQPIAVQQLAAPAPAEPDEASVLAWLSEHRPDAVVTDAFGCPCIAPPAKVPQGRLARLRAAWRG